jgi:hypothetical protein
VGGFERLTFALPSAFVSATVGVPFSFPNMDMGSRNFSKSGTELSRIARASSVSTMPALAAAALALRERRAGFQNKEE